MNASVATVHGFRSAFRDWAAETMRFPREVAELALAHTVGSAVERAYRRSDLFELRRQRWRAGASSAPRSAAKCWRSRGTPYRNACHRIPSRRKKDTLAARPYEAADASSYRGVRAIDISLDPAPVLRSLIAAIPDNRLRDVVLELALRGVPSEAPATPAAPAASPRPAAKRTRPGWSKARRLAFEKAKATNGTAAAAKPDYNTVRRERRAAERPRGRLRRPATVTATETLKASRQKPSGPTPEGSHRESPGARSRASSAARMRTPAKRCEPWPCLRELPLRPSRAF